MKPGYYILNGRKIIECNLYKWGEFLENVDNRRIGLTEKGDIKVSTVFLGIDHNFGEGEPLLFETMVFGGEHDGDEERYSTWEEAEKGHAEMCKKVFGEIKNPFDDMEISG